MSAPNVGHRPIVPSFESVEALRGGLAAKANFEAVDLYHRDGSRLLGEVEDRLAALTRVEPGEALAYNSGMAAVTDAIDVALLTSSPEAGKLPKIACAEETYSQTRRYIEHFVRGKQADVVYFDSGNVGKVERVLRAQRPDVIITETIANYVNVPVLNTEHLLEATRVADKKPAVILDNTLPLPTAQSVGTQLEAEDKIIVVESGTKGYTFNTELLGVSYTANEQLHDYLRRLRRTRGTLPGARSLQGIAEVLPEDVEDFDTRNSLIFFNTAAIVGTLAARGEGNTDFTISNPGVPTHDNHGFYQERYFGNATPLLYVQSTKFDQYEVAEKLWANPDVREQAKLGQSFGFDKARIVADENVGAVRIAGGANIDGHALGAACADALFGEQR